MEAKRYDQIYAEMRDYVIAHQDRISDFNSGSVISSILEALSRQLAGLYLKAMADVAIYTKNTAYAQFGFERKGGVAATGYVTFSRLAATLTDVVIPSGTVVKSGSGIAFATAAETMIASGSLASAPVIAKCQDVGISGNISASMISSIANRIIGVDAVGNAAAFAGGVDRETDIEYAARFREYIEGLGKSSIPGIRSAALAVNGVKSVSVVEHFPPEAGFNFTVFAEDGSGYLPAATLATVQAILDGDAVTSGSRACGLRCRTLPPGIVTISPSITIKINWEIPRGLIEDDIRNKITSYVNGLGIGEPYDSKMIYNMLVGETGVIEIQSMSPSTTTPTDRQIIRLGLITLVSV